MIKQNKIIISYSVRDFLSLATPLEFRTYEYWMEANEINSLR